MGKLVAVVAVVLLFALPACRKSETQRPARPARSERELPTAPPKGAAKAMQPWDAYRTGLIDERVFDVPADIRGGIFRQPEKYVDRLVRFLIKGARDDFHKAKLLHDWVAENIEYDVKGYFSGEYKQSGGGGFADTLRSGNSVCEGYASLFEHMCSLAGLECVKVSGYGRGYGHRLFEPEDPTKSNHAWNAVKIHGNWHLMDITWDAGHVGDSREYVKKYGTGYLFLEPEKFVFTHFPTEAKWQLLDPPYSVEEFKDLPSLRGEFFGYGLELAEPVAGLTRVGESASLELLVPEDMQLLAHLADPDDQKLYDRVFFERGSGATRVQMLFPKRGMWKLRLFARNEEDEDPDRYQWVGDLGYEASTGTESRFPKVFGQYGALGCHLVEPMRAPLRAGEPTRFTVDAPGVAGVTVLQGEEWTKLEREHGERWTGTAVPGRDQAVKVLVQLRPDSRQWEWILEYD